MRRYPPHAGLRSSVPGLLCASRLSWDLPFPIYLAFLILPGHTSAGALLRGGNLRKAHPGLQLLEFLIATTASHMTKNTSKKLNQ